MRPWAGTTAPTTCCCGERDQPLAPERAVLAPLCAERGSGPSPAPPAPAPLISDPAALCVLGVGGDEPRSPRRPPGRRTGLGGGHTALRGPPEDGEGAGVRLGRRCGGTGGRYRASLGSGRRMPESREPALLPGFVCACFTGRGARACHPPGPRDPRPRRGTTPGTIARRVPPRPGLRLTRSLHRQHPDSSVCSFVCFKYIYILYIYINILIYLGARGGHRRAASPAAAELRG